MLEIAASYYSKTADLIRDSGFHLSHQA